MNRVISDTAEYGCYLFANRCVPLLKDFMKTVTKEDIGAVYGNFSSVVSHLFSLRTADGATGQHYFELHKKDLNRKSRSIFLVFFSNAVLFLQTRIRSEQGNELAPHCEAYQTSFDIPRILERNHAPISSTGCWRMARLTSIKRSLSTEVLFPAP